MYKKCGFSTIYVSAYNITENAQFQSQNMSTNATAMRSFHPKRCSINLASLFNTYKYGFFL